MIRNIKEKIVKYFEKFNIEMIYLFGSVVRDELKDNSDIDIALVGSFNFNDKWKFSTELIDILNREVDIIDFNNVDLNFKSEIIITGKCIYYKNEELKDEMEMKILSNYLSFEEDRRIVLDEVFKRGSVFLHEKSGNK